MPPLILALCAALLAAASLLGAAPAAAAPAAAPLAVEADATVQRYRGWIADMKTARRGPFDGIRWFCEDGQVLEPEPYACTEFGGGVQHGHWSDRTQTIRDAGWPIATVLIELDPADVHGSDAADQRLREILLERWLVDFDDGWILRRARGYRGAFQIENERAAAREVLLTLLADDAWLQRNFLTAREAARLLPLAGDTARVETIRSLSSQLAEQDAAFEPIRNRIHVSPSASDAQRTRAYAKQAEREDDQAAALELAAAIDSVYSDGAVTALLDVGIRTPGINQVVDLPHPRDVARTTAVSQRLVVVSELLAELRGSIQTIAKPADRLTAMRLSLAAEVSLFATAQALLNGPPQALSRADWLDMLGAAADAAYGAGLLTRRERAAQAALLGERLQRMTALEYRKHLNALGRASLWGTRRIRFEFSNALAHFGELEPLVVEYPVDRLRSSPLFVHARILERLNADASRLLGVEHQVFGEPVQGQLDVLNPGVARGVLTLDPATAAGRDLPSIVLVPETVPNLPPVAGILTAEAGNALSHVQLLAASLGVPNVVVGADLLPRIRALAGTPVELVASAGGVVRLQAVDAAVLAAAKTEQQASKSTRTLKIPVDKLQLDQRVPIPVADLTSDDSGRTVGPKAAKLGTLMDQFPAYVSPGLAIPFGVYRELLDTPMPGFSGTRFEWMKASYGQMLPLRESNPAGYRAMRDVFLADMRTFFLTVPLTTGFVDQLKQSMRQTFGENASYGVFVRSDTNVEDLPNFTGAGLNLTVPHVVGEDAIITAIRRVWASPFTERAFGWRQALVDQPEHVYAAVLLHQSVPAVVSGVMVTSIDGKPIQVVVNEGVGGGVEGDSAESVLIEPRGGDVTLIGTATAATRTVLLPEGGIVKQPTSGSPQLLGPARIEALRQLAQTAPKQFDLNGQAADIEFGFYDDKLWLFQIRPFVQKTAHGPEAEQLDASLQARAALPVDLNEPPRSAQ